MDDNIKYKHLDKYGRCSTNINRSNCTRDQLLVEVEDVCKTSQCGENEVPFYDGTYLWNR